VGGAEIWGDECGQICGQHCGGYHTVRFAALDGARVEGEGETLADFGRQAEFEEQ